jgi:hypothetical protein
MSAVSAEFRNYRDSLKHDLDRPNLTVKVQEDFIATGGYTLDKLDDYILQCDAIVHLIGDMTGAMALESSVAVIRQRYPDFVSRFPMLKPYVEAGGPDLSYTQWEAWLALYHERTLLIAVPESGAPRHDKYQFEKQHQANQQNHLELLKLAGLYPEISFTNADRLAVELLGSRLLDILPPIRVASQTLDRLRKVASSLLKAGRVNWNMPEFVAPMNLNIIKNKANLEDHPTNIEELTEAMNVGENIIFFGEGGIGKTTFILALSDAVLTAKHQRVPFYIDAGYWASTDTEILDYIASRAEAQMHGVSTHELVKLAKVGHITLAINGWNEIPISKKLVCLDRLTQLTASAKAMNVVIASRSMNDATNLNTIKQVQVRGLTWQAQSAVIRSELDEESANALIERLAKTTQLRHSARNPLILKGLLAQAKKGVVASLCEFDLLGAVIDEYEDDYKRQLLLAEPPLRSHHRVFLEALACQLTSMQETTASRRGVLPTISKTALQLVNAGQYGITPEPSDIIDALSSRHLLHGDGQSLRFAHQRLQEYFAATKLLKACSNDNEQGITLLKEVVNQPFWEDALRLVAGKLKGGVSNAQARSKLIRITLEIDLGFACKLAGICELSDADDHKLYRDLVAYIEALCDSQLNEVANYGLGCLIASGFNVFSERLWPLIENDNQQVRLNSYRSAEVRISLKQLGKNAATRISSWTPDSQAELIHELADNSDNYNFLVLKANQGTEVKVRAAAIAALSWNFPTSDASLKAWLRAPENVQLEHSAIQVIEYELDQEGCNSEILEKIRFIGLERLPFNLLLILARSFPKELGESTVNKALDQLLDQGSHDFDKSLLELAKQYAPERLKVLMRQLLLTERTIPDWVKTSMQQESEDNRSDVYEAAWDILNNQDSINLCEEALGSLANRAQTLRCVLEWLNHYQDRRGKQSDEVRERYRQLGFLLANAPGKHILSVVMELGGQASYDDSSELLELVWSRMKSDDVRTLEMNQWQPSLAATEMLITGFRNKLEEKEILQHRVIVILCSIASYISPDYFSKFLLEGCTLHLDSWHKYNEKLKLWIKTPTRYRPSNPILGNYLISAMGDWGVGALPELLKLLEHPQSSNLVPECLIRILNEPWASKRKGIFYGFGAYSKEGERRRLAGRELSQPDDTHQEITNIVARALGKNLTVLVQHLLEEKSVDSDKFNERNAAYRMSGLLNIVASTPSAEIIEPLMDALANGFIDIYSSVKALGSLICQGAHLEQVEVVARIESLYWEESKATWFDESKRGVMAKLCQIMYFVKPVSLLSKPLTYYLTEWQRLDSICGVIRQLGAISSDKSWDSLLYIYKNIELNQRESEELTIALTSSMGHEHFSEFLDLVESGTWFDCSIGRHIASKISSIIGSDTARLSAFLKSCEYSASPNAMDLACEVLSLIPDCDDIRTKFGLAALDMVEVPSYSIYSMLMKMFTNRVSLEAKWHYEIYPKAVNHLRKELYFRAKGDGHSAMTSRRLLADIETQRQEIGRPADELRHPAIEEGLVWTDTLITTGRNKHPD